MSDDSNTSGRFHIPPAPYFEIIDITPEIQKVRLIATVIASDVGSLLIDDGTSSITVVTDKNIDIGSKVIVIGNVLMQQEDIIIMADIVHKIDAFDITLYKEVLELEKNIEELYT